jgi:hypothetical protein
MNSFPMKTLKLLIALAFAFAANASFGNISNPNVYLGGLGLAQLTVNGSNGTSILNQNGLQTYYAPSSINAPTSIQLDAYAYIENAGSSTATSECDFVVPTGGSGQIWYQFEDDASDMNSYVTVGSNTYYEGSEVVALAPGYYHAKAYAYSNNASEYRAALLMISITYP